MIRTCCGFGDMDNAGHREICLACSKGYWREQHPGLATLQTVTWTLLVILFLFCMLYILFDYARAIRRW